MEPSAVAAKIDELETRYRIPEGNRIKEFLASRPGLVEILLEGYPYMEGQFGNGVPVEIRFFPDYEGDPEADIMANIQSPFDLDRSAAKYDRFWDEWWSVASRRREASGLLLIGMDYVGEPA